jgi:two-component system chemotaxis response regulator CheY
VNVLVADDDGANRLILKTIVTRLGHACSVAEDGDAAWAHLLHHPVDVLLTDWMMPGIEGPELCRRLRSDPAAPYTYVVLITALSDHDQVLAGMNAGADDYLAKPVEPFQVETRLVAARRVTHLHRQLRSYRDELEASNIELLDQSRTDSLTGLGNRRLMERDLALAVARAERQQSTFSVALFDVDHFKAYNDHYGHGGGDTALRLVARTLSAACRASDSVYRYGGEEFLAIFHDQHLAGALAAADRLRAAVEARAEPHLNSALGHLTVSGGVSVWTSTDTSLEGLLRAADEALYLSKQAGRNSISGARPGGRMPRT